MSALNLPANPFISVFDYRVQFDLSDGTIKIDLSPSVIQDASGITVDLAITRPDQAITNIPGAFTTSTINQIYNYSLPKVQGVYMWGLYTIKATLNLAVTNPVSYAMQKKLNLCAPDSKNPYANEMTGSIMLTVDCAMGTLTASGFCGYAYRGQPPISEVYNLTRFYPPEAELLPQKNLSAIPFVVDAYVGLNTVKGVNTATYDFGDNVFAIIRIVATTTKNVRCGIDFESIYCGMSALLNQLKACNATPAEYNIAFGEINALLWTVTVGVNENKDVEDYIERLEKLLGVDCRCAACAGEKVGPTCVPDCPQVTNATAIVDTTVTPPVLKISYTGRTPISTVHVEYRPYCDSVNEPWIDAGYYGPGSPVQVVSIPIIDPLTYQVRLTSILADGSYCDPTIITAQGTCPDVVGLNQPPVYPPPAQLTADWDWSSTAVNQTWPSYQRHVNYNKGGDLEIDFADSQTGTNADNVFLIVRYPSSDTVKATWYNSQFNFGSLPDSVFATYDDGTYKYIWSRFQPTLDANDKKITFKI